MSDLVAQAQPPAPDGFASEGYTVDAFHRGAFHLVQPARKGHRAGMDAMMLAASVPAGFAGALADLGAGAGAAGLAVAARCSEARVTLIERAPEMIECARRSLAHASNRMIAERCAVIEADVTLTGSRRVDAGLVDRSFDFAIMNPPFNTPHDRRSPDPLRETAHVMEDGMFEAWIRTASAIVRPRGGLCLIARPHSLDQILEALRGRFGNARILPVHARGEEPAIRIILRAWRGSRQGLSIAPALILHENGSDRFSERADAIANGRLALFSD